MIIYINEKFINIENKLCFYGFDFACENGHIDIVKYLIDKYPNL